MKLPTIIFIFLTGVLFSNNNYERAVVAGGCFWGVEGVFEEIKGVVKVTSGYAGGKESTASYDKVASGVTDHAESVEIIYDPEVISYKKLLEIFFLIVHDPRQLNFQGPDRGRQYRSAVFYLNNTQRELVNDYIAELDKIPRFKNSIVTEVSELNKFYPASEYHQDFIQKNPENGYVCQWDIPKINKLREEYPELVK